MPTNLVGARRQSRSVEARSATLREAHLGRPAERENAAIRTDGSQLEEKLLILDLKPLIGTRMRVFHKGQGLCHQRKSLIDNIQTLQCPCFSVCRCVIVYCNRRPTDKATDDEFFRKRAAQYCPGRGDSPTRTHRGARPPRLGRPARRLLNEKDRASGGETIYVWLTTSVRQSDRSLWLRSTRRTRHRRWQSAKLFIVLDTVIGCTFGPYPAARTWFFHRCERSSSCTVAFGTDTQGVATQVLQRRARCFGGQSLPPT
jgi:hypothetical protein